MNISHQQGWAGWAFSAILFTSTATVGWLYYQANQNNSELNAQLTASQSELRASERSLRQSTLDLETAQQNLISSQAEIANLRSQLAANQTKLTQTEQAQRQLEQNKRQLEAQLQQLNSELDTKTAIAEQNQQTNAQLTEQMNELNKQIDLLNAETLTLENQVAALNEQSASLSAELATLTTQTATLQAQIAESEQQKANLDAQKAQLEQDIAQLKSDYQTATTQLTRSRKSIEELKGELSEAEITQELYLAAREQLALQQSENETYSETIARLEREMAAEALAMADLEASLQSQLSEANQEKEQLVTQLRDGTTAIKLPESILFASGSAQLNEDGIRALDVLGDALKSFPNHLISIQGHTDSKKIASSITKIYPTNWELSGARASSAVRHLIEQGYPPQQMQAVGFADTRPLVEEVDDQTRQQNRRIEVILFPNQYTTRVLDSVAN